MSDFSLPNIREPFLAQNGQITRAWWIWLQQLMAQISTGDGTDLSQIVQTLNALIRDTRGLERTGAESAQGPAIAELTAALMQLASVQAASVPSAAYEAQMAELQAMAIAQVSVHGRWSDPDMHEVATATSAGFMSATDKAKLDGIGASSCFSAYRSSSQAIAATTFTTIVFNTELFDDLSEYDTATGVFTAQQAGTYNFTASIVAAAMTSPMDRVMALYVNGVERIRMALTRLEPGNAMLAGTSGPVRLAASDQVTLRYFSGNADTVQASQSMTYFSGWRIK